MGGGGGGGGGTDDFIIDFHHIWSYTVKIDSE